MLTITNKNFRECQSASEELRAHLDLLARMTQQYPVECTFGGYRFIFRTRQDVIDLIAQLDEKLASFNSAA
jgi:hypothetical protein